MTAILVSCLLGLLGFAYLALGEMEARSVRRHVDRERCRQAALDVATLASTWWRRPDGRGGPEPAASEWRGAYRAWLEAGRESPFWDGLPAGRLSGDAAVPDLLLEKGSPFLAELAATLDEDLVIERLAIDAADDPGVRARLTCTVAIRHGRELGARVSLSAQVLDAPAFRGPEVVASGGDVRLAPGARVRWGLVRADGDVRVPPAGAEGFPASGLPRGSGGFEPRHFAPGGPVDWNPRTGFRECVLTELIGYTSGGERVPAGELSPPPIRDPWLAVHAGHRLIVGESTSWSGRPGARQPLPHDPRRGGLELDASHLVQRLGPGADPSLGGRADDLAAGRTGPQGGQTRAMRRFVLAGEEPGGEALWREGAAGPARPAAEWLRGSEAAPFLAVFTAGGRDLPGRVTLNEGAGVVVVEARELRLRATGGGREEAVNMPGEPFQDRGIDTDGDGWVEPGTAGNGRWDCDCDGDGRPDEQPPRDLMFDFVHGDVGGGKLPDGDRDPTGLATAPHEPFLNFAWPTDWRDPAVRVSYAGLEGFEARPVRDLDGDGAFRPDEDLFTSSAHDAVGARLRTVLHFRGLVVNLAGSVELGAGFRMFGAVRAAGDVELLAGAELSHDGELARSGRPDGLGLPPVVLGPHAWAQGRLRRSPPVPREPAAEAAAPAASLGPRPGATQRGNRG